MKTEKYTMNKIREIIADDSISISPEMVNVDIVLNNIYQSIANVCGKYNIKVPQSFKNVIKAIEKEILKSPNWFNRENMNFQSFKDCLSMSCVSEEEFIKSFGLQYSERGDKNSITYDVNELIATACGNYFQDNLMGFYKWNYLKNLRLRNINIIDESDAYKSEKIDFLATAKNPIIKKNKCTQVMLVASHTHSYSRNNIDSIKDYSVILEKFKLTLVLLSPMLN